MFRHACDTSSVEESSTSFNVSPPHCLTGVELCSAGQAFFSRRCFAAGRHGFGVQGDWASGFVQYPEHRTAYTGLHFI